jgi:hypothetical protein
MSREQNGLETQGFDPRTSRMFDMVDILDTMLFAGCFLMTLDFSSLLEVLRLALSSNSDNAWI